MKVPSIVALFMAASLAAQEETAIIGRVVGPDSRPLEGARVAFRKALSRFEKK